MEAPSQETVPFRVSMVPGIMPGKWLRTWQQRHPATPLDLVSVDDTAQLTGVREGTAQMAFVRDVEEHEGLHLIPLYDELSVVVLPQDHPWAEATELTSADLDEEHVVDLSGLTTRQAVEVVASGTGVVFLPMSVARLHHRKDVVAVPVTDLPQHPVGLVWPRGAEAEDARIEDFIGIVRGRTARSSRGSGAPAQEPAKKRVTPERRSASRPGRGRGGRGASPRRGGRRRG